MACDDLFRRIVVDAIDPPAHDPYLWWAMCTGFAAFPLPTDGTLPFLIQLREPYDPEKLGKELPWLKVPDAYGESLGRSGKNSTYITGRLPVAALFDFIISKVVVRFQLGLPRIRDRPVFPAAKSVRSVLGPGETETAFGLIDDGMALAHPQFRVLPDRSRFKCLWDQDASRDTKNPWTLVPIMEYGAQLFPPSIGAGPQGEAQFYRDVRYLNDTQDPRASRAHGTAVAGIAAGNQSPLLSTACAAGPDIASQVPIVAVQLPTRTVQDTSGGSLAVHVLDGMRYIIWHAEDRTQTPPPYWRQPDTRVVINASFGGAAGPHDGQSMLDQAVDELVQCRGNLAVVLPAGNARESRIHALLCVPGATTAGAGSASVRFTVLADDPTDSFVELWFDATTSIADVIVDVQAPDGSSASVSADRIIPIGAGWAHAVFLRKPAQSPRKPMLLIAIAPTAFRSSAPDRKLSPAGSWALTARNAGAAAFECHAWIERDDLIGRRPVPQQTRFEWSAQECQSLTLNSIGHAECSVTIAGHVRSDGQPADYSGAGPTRDAGRTGPDASAVSDDGYALRGVPVIGTRSWFRNERMSGTSVSAPRVARWLLNQPTWTNPRQDVRDEAARQDGGAAKPGKPRPSRERIGDGRFPC